MKLARLIPIFALFFLSTVAMAQGLQEKTTDGGVRYLSGGVGDSEIQAIREATPRYSLSVLMATKDGSYLSNVDVKIQQKGGKQVLAAVTEGPVLLADLPMGTYSLTATAEGKTMNERFNLTKGQHRRIVLRWPAVKVE